MTDMRRLGHLFFNFLNLAKQNRDKPQSGTGVSVSKTVGSGCVAKTVSGFTDGVLVVSVTAGENLTQHVTGFQT